MKIIICLDDINGMLFNKRRLSVDKILCQKIIDIVQDSRLWLNGYSAQLFEPICDKVYVDENFAQKAQKGEFCFFESQDANKEAFDAEEIIVFRWNRRYPSDVRFSQANLLNRKLIYTEDFPGNSHDRITMEVYR